MPGIFYQANFCAECGNLLEPQRGWRPRYFCGHCAARIRRRGRIRPFSSILVLLVIWIALDGRQHSISPPNPFGHANRANQANRAEAPPAVSAQDASPGERSLKLTEAQEQAYCGARTKKGTPCRRLVLPGQRCAQHRGMPSILNSNLQKKTRDL